MTGTDLACGVLVVVGLFGIVVPVIPGTVLVLLGILVWASETGTTLSWTVFGLAAACLVVGEVVKYAVPGRRLKATVPTQTLLLGGVGAVVGFFVIPIVGALAGFPIGVYLAERARVGPDGAWTSTAAALKAVATSILIELVAAVAATAIWVTGLLVT
jgi:uncharacterized protein YqgC (DUF456 family)